MHAVFKDDAERVVDCRTDVRLVRAESWLASSSGAVVCEVYDDDRRVRGKLVARFTRDPESGLRAER